MFYEILTHIIRGINYGSQSNNNGTQQHAMHYE